MRRPIAVAALLMLAIPAWADEALPLGWTQREDGAYVHAQTTTVCPRELADHTRTSLRVGTPPIIAECTYAKGADMIGIIRIRNYVPGQGETELAIENDRKLMEPGTTTVSAGRMPPVRPSEGKQRFITTVARGGLLIDCDSTFPLTIR
jgi:hypothetical protein